MSMLKVIEVLADSNQSLGGCSEAGDCKCFKNGSEHKVNLDRKFRGDGRCRQDHALSDQREISFMLE